MKLSIQEKYGKRELERQINSSFYERVMIGKAKLSIANQAWKVGDITKHTAIRYIN